MKDLSVSLVIPAYNEVEAIAEVVAEHHEALARHVREFEIIVVDDGSTDDTARAVDAKMARVVRHPANGGYGKSLQTGIEAAKHEWVLMTDADGTYPVSEAMRLLDYAPDFDLVIGARQGAHFWGSPVKTLSPCSTLPTNVKISGALCRPSSTTIPILKTLTLMARITSLMKSVMPACRALGNQRLPCPPFPAIPRSLVK
jgi:glycosyltransferase involved in cell wall biosynthesis